MNLRQNTAMSLLALTLVLSGCGAKGTDNIESQSPTASATTSPSAMPTESSSETPSEDPGKLILKEFKDLALAGKPANELFASLKQHIGEVQPEQADEFIRTMEAYYKDNLPIAQQELEGLEVQKELNALKWPITEEKIRTMKDGPVKELAIAKMDGGYKLISSEGFVFPIVDYGKFLSYGDDLTTPMKTYLEVLAAESDSPTASDGGLIITWDELSAKTLAAESYVVTFPDSPERREIEDRYLNYLSMYLIGLNNTPIFDYDTFVVLPAVKSQYEQMVASHAGTVTGQLTKELLSVLEKTNGAVYTKGKKGEQVNIPETQKFREELETKARSLLPASKN